MSINKPGCPFSSNQNIFWFAPTKIWITGSTTISIATRTLEKMNLVIVPAICLSKNLQILILVHEYDSWTGDPYLSLVQDTLSSLWQLNCVKHFRYSKSAKSLHHRADSWTEHSCPQVKCKIKSGKSFIISFTRFFSELRVFGDHHFSVDTW